MDYIIKRGGRREVTHMEPMLDYFYNGISFLQGKKIVSEFKNGLELLILKDDRERDLGFSVKVRSTVSKRALIAAMALYPMPENRGQGRYRDFLRVLEERYGETYSGLLFLLPKSETFAEAREELSELPLEIEINSKPFGLYVSDENDLSELKYRAEEELRNFMLMLISATDYKRSFSVRSLI